MAARSVEKRGHFLTSKRAQWGLMNTFDPTPYANFDHMSSGKWYLAVSEELGEISGRAAALFHEYNQIGPTDPERSREILHQWLHPDSGECTIKAPAIIEYGINTTIAEDVFINFGLTILDICPVTIGARSMLGPNCQILTAGHPVNDHEMRRGGWENGSPVHIGEDVWLGGGVTVVGGVSIGDRAVIGAGAVVTRDIPADSIAVGNPARVIKMRDDQKLERTELPVGVPVEAVAALRAQEDHGQETPAPEART